MNENKDLRYLISKSDLTAEELLKEINLEEFKKVLLIYDSRGIIPDLIKLLIENGHQEILEKNIEYVPSEIWEKFKDNKEFKCIFNKNIDRIFQKQKFIHFSELNSLVDEENAEKFYTENIDNVINTRIGSKANFLLFLNQSDWGKKLASEKQDLIFSKMEDINMQLAYLELENVDTSIYLEGIMANFENIYNREKEDAIYLIYKINDMMNKSDLDIEKINEMKKKILDAVVIDGKLDEELVNSIVEDEELEVLKSLRNYGIEKDVLKKEQDKFLQCIDRKKIIDYINSCVDYEGLPQNFRVKQLVEKLYTFDERDIINNVIYSDKQNLYIIERLITEIAQIQNIDPMKTKIVGSGNFSDSLKIGDFILKIGSVRATPTIPYHKRIIAPIIRQQSDKSLIDIFVEIQNVGDANWYQGMTKEEINEELYKIYSELRDSDIYWPDIDKENVVRLLKPNKLNFKLDGKEIYRNEHSVQMKGLKEGEELEKGQLVVSDSDYIYDKENILFFEPKSIPKQRYELYKKFEERYNKEHVISNHDDYDDLE